MMIFSNNGQERMRLDSNGNFGIGTLSPSTSFPISVNRNYRELENRRHNGSLWHTISASEECVKWLETQDSEAWAPVLNYYRVREDLYTYLVLKFAD